MKLKYVMLVCCVQTSALFTMDRLNKLLFAFGKESSKSVRITLSNSLQKALSNDHILKNDSVVTSKSISGEKGLDLLSNILSLEYDDESDVALKNLLRNEEPKTVLEVSNQLKEWQISVDLFCTNCEGADLLVSNEVQWILDGEVRDIKISKDSQMVVAAFNNGTCNSYDITGKLLEKLATREPHTPCTSIALTPNKQTLAISYQDEDLVWRSANNSTETIPFGQNLEQSYCSLKTAPHGTLLMLRTDQGIQVYLVNGVRSISQYSKPLFWPVLFNHTGEFIYAPDSNNNKNLLILDSENGQVSAIGTGGNVAKITAINCSHDSKYIFTGDKDGGLAIYDATGNPCATIPAAHKEEVFAIAVAYNQKYLFATGGFDGQIKLWNFEQDWNIVKPQQTISGGMQQVCKLKFTTDDSWILSWDTDENNNGSTRIWDRSGKNIYTWNKTVKFSLSSDNQFLALIQSPKGAAVYSLKALKELGLLPTLVRAKFIDLLVQLKKEKNNPQLKISSLRSLVKSVKESGYAISHIAEFIERNPPVTK